MVVEPESLCWLSGRMVQARDGVTWAQEFARFPALKRSSRFLRVVGNIVKEGSLVFRIADGSPAPSTKGALVP